MRACVVLEFEYLDPLFLNSVRDQYLYVDIETKLHQSINNATVHSTYFT